MEELETEGSVDTSEETCGEEAFEELEVRDSLEMEEAAEELALWGEEEQDASNNAVIKRKMVFLGFISFGPTKSL